MGGCVALSNESLSHRLHYYYLVIRMELVGVRIEPDRIHTYARMIAMHVAATMTGQPNSSPETTEMNAESSMIEDTSTYSDAWSDGVGR